jgi:hypothetical protein
MAASIRPILLLRPVHGVSFSCGFAQETKARVCKQALVNLAGLLSALKTYFLSLIAATAGSKKFVAMY